MNSLYGRFAKILISLAIVASPVVAWSQRWEIYDWWRLRSYEAPAEISSLADRTQMTDYARRLFFVYRATLNDKHEFNQNCQGSEQTIVLGCYVANTGIYLYDVEDPRLDGIEEVTAAHEVLHAAYGRLSSDEKKNINTLLETKFNSLPEGRLRDTVESYRAKDPNVVPNELHSILGTELRDLGPDLESYYKRYFKDRSLIVGFSEQYERAFSERQTKIKQYDAELTRLKDDIESLQANLDQQRSNLNSEQRRLDSLRSSGRYDEYNSGVAGYNSLVQRYNSDARRLQNMIDRYNQMVEERNAIAHEENELLEAIDSRPSTIEAR